MNNMVNTGSISNLQAGNSLLVHARRVSGGKLQLEIAEVTSASSPSLLGMFNQSDSRFSQQGARRAWMTVEAEDAGRLLGIDLSDNNPAWMTDEQGREILPLNILNPEVGGQVLRLKIEETTTPTAWQAANIQTAAKRKGAQGDFITHGGKYIFSNTNIVFGQVGEVIEHKLLAADETTQASVTHSASPFDGINS